MATLKQLIRNHRIRMDAEYLPEGNPHMLDMPPGSTHWKCTLKYGRRRMTVPFSMGPALTGQPDIESVLDCLVSDSWSADECFDSWCHYYGHDTDSRRAEKTYKAVQHQTAKLRRLLGENLVAEMAESER